jgi:DnaJ-class molecular chaperone
MSDSIKEKNHYELLGVARNASTEEIKSAYKELARIFHPDSHYFDELLEEVDLKDIAPSDNTTFKAVTNAYNELSDPARRAAYDKTLPRELQGWESDEIPSGFDDGRFSGNIPLSTSARAIPKPSRAFGVFGKIQESEPQQETQPQDEEADAAKPGGLWERLKRLFR